MEELEFRTACSQLCAGDDVRGCARHGASLRAKGVACLIRQYDDVAGENGRSRMGALPLSPLPPSPPPPSPPPPPPPTAVTAMVRTGMARGEDGVTQRMHPSGTVLTDAVWGSGASCSSSSSWLSLVDDDGLVQRVVDAGDRRSGSTGQMREVGDDVRGKLRRVFVDGGVDVKPGEAGERWTDDEREREGGKTDEVDAMGKTTAGIATRSEGSVEWEGGMPRAPTPPWMGGCGTNRGRRMGDDVGRRAGGGEKASGVGRSAMMRWTGAGEWVRRKAQRVRRQVGTMKAIVSGGEM